MQTLGIGVLDVTISTLHVISVFDGRMKTSFLLGFVEVVVWLSVIWLTQGLIEENPWLGLFFVLGFSTSLISTPMTKCLITFPFATIR